VNKQKLLSWLQDPTTLTSGDLKKLDDLQKEYPFFSIAYALNAKLKKEEDTPDAKQALGMAALYTADRHVLKLFLSPPQKVEETPPPLPEPSQKASTATAKEATKAQEESPIIPEEKKSESEQTTKESIDHSDDSAPNIRRIVFADEPSENNHLEESFYEEVENNLKNLRAQKSALSMWMRLHEHDLSPKNDPTQEETTPEPEESPAQNISSPPPLPEGSATTDHPSILQKEDNYPKTPPPLPELDSYVATEKPVEAPSEESVPPPLPSTTETKTPEADHHPPLDQVIDAQQKEKPVTGINWQQEQTEMIDRFLAEENKLKKKGELNAASNSATQEDLSLKSQEFGDNIISENLARILTKQGKTERAIEIYRKLIWKFPQKRSYFADLIEQLKDSE